MSNLSSKVSEQVDDLDLLGAGSEEAVWKEGYDEGFKEGFTEGSRTGWDAGIKTGTDVGFELGRFKGFALAAREELEKSPAPEGGASSNRSRALKLCDKVIKLVDEFKLENVTSVQDAVSQIHNQYCLLKLALGIKEEAAAVELEGDKDKQSSSTSGQKYSF